VPFVIFHMRRLNTLEKKARERAARRNVREEQIQAQEPEGKDLSLADIQAAAGLNF